ncbi:MAG: HesA/MoeB/ThiF family protein [Candidatus Binatia bacterium]
MDTQIILPTRMAEELRAHLLGDRSREQMAIVLCGVQRSETRTRLLGRHLIVMPPEAFSHQSAVGLQLRPEVQRHILMLAAHEQLSQIDFHTHPGDGPHVGFSGTDDQSERTMAAYLAERLPDTMYGSVVANSSAITARIWNTRDGEVRPLTIAPPDFAEGMSFVGNNGHLTGMDAARFDRQIGAFGQTFQTRMQSLQVGIVGLGGLGGIFVEELTRLGVRDWKLVDPDVVEMSNLNRLLGATVQDVEEEHAKVDVAARNIERIDANARVVALRCTVFTERALKALSSCDILIAATDNDASRLVVNALAAQYLIPLVHAGVNLSVRADGRFDDISGEVAVPSFGSWCLLCGGMIDATRAAQDLARPEERQLLRERGYLAGVAAPAVYHLNGTVASLAVAELHNLVAPYRSLRRYLVYRELEGEMMAVNVPQNEECLHCSPEGRLGLGDLVPMWRPNREARGQLPAAIPNAVAEVVAEVVDE